MTDQNLTEIVAIIDRSGSMFSYVQNTIGGYNQFVEEQRKVDGKATITLVQFDDKYQVDYSGVDINDAKLLDEKTYVPRGNTALFDAVGKTINTIGERLANTEEDKRPGKVIVMIITDGEENSSTEFTQQQVSEMVKHQTDKYSWTFVFLGGGNLEAQKHQAIKLGVCAANAYGYNLHNVEDVYTSISKGVTRSRKLAPDQVTDSFLIAEEVACLVK